MLTFSINVRHVKVRNFLVVDLDFKIQLSISTFFYCKYFQIVTKPFSNTEWPCKTLPVPIILQIQSNLCTTATLGTPKKWPLFRGWPLFRVWSKILGNVILGLVRQGIRAGRCWQVAVVQRWPLAQVWLYTEGFYGQSVEFILSSKNLFYFLLYLLLVGLLRGTASAWDSLNC